MCGGKKQFQQTDTDTHTPNCKLVEYSIYRECVTGSWLWRQDAIVEAGDCALGPLGPREEAKAGPFSKDSG